MSPTRTTAVQEPKLYSRFYIDSELQQWSEVLPLLCKYPEVGRREGCCAEITRLPLVLLRHRLECHLFRVTSDTCGCIRSDSMRCKLNHDTRGSNDLQHPETQSWETNKNISSFYSWVMEHFSWISMLDRVIAGGYVLNGLNSWLGWQSQIHTKLANMCPSSLYFPAGEVFIL